MYMVNNKKGEKMNYIYDVVVVGGGHGGVEASLASARIGRKTLLITMSLDSIAMMSCNRKMQ